MQRLTDFFVTLDGYIGGSQWFVFLLLGTGLFFTFYLGFPQIRYFRHAWRVLSGRYDDPDHPGDTSHYQSLTTALSGTIGTGNIAGVALAIHLGGPAALFWMLMTALVGMTTKMVEVTLSHKYREVASDGTIAGGPMYYMKNRLKAPVLAAVFALATVVCSFGMGCLPQINSISNAIYATVGLEHWITGAVLAVLLGFIIVGGIRRIVKVTERIVPLMTAVYLVGALAVLIANRGNILPAMGSVFTGVFSGTAASGGFLGAGFVWAFNRGVNRGLFSNEAGQGSAPIAHAAAKANEPVSEGLVALLEPFIDTVIVCALTGIVLLSSGVWKEKVDNTFQYTDLVVLADLYDESDPAQRQSVARFIAGEESLPLYDGVLKVEQGRIADRLTLVHARSFADSVRVELGGRPFTGEIPVSGGKPVVAGLSDNTVLFKGKSLIHSAPLSSEAFKRSLLGQWGQYVIPLCLLLFAFSTAIAWSYYGDRAITYLLGTQYVMAYRLLYVVMFFIASFVDTSIVWAFSGITVALMTLPNLIGILLLHKEVKGTVRQYWTDFRREHPRGK